MNLKRIILKWFNIILIIESLMLVNTYAEIGPIDQASLEKDLDTFITDYMIRYHIPGAVFVFVNNGKVLCEKGYGYADLESQTAVNPEITVFRVASNSKLFIATAAMQLIEQGKLLLDEDINNYLKTLKIPNKPDNPISMKNLLTHTAGFDDVDLNMSTLKKEERLELGDFLNKAMPDLVMESGQVTSYSNYGMNLAAYIIESISGMPFHLYVEENILNPLQMKNSSFMPKPNLMKNKATPYLFINNKHEILPHDYLHGYPCGSFMTTGSDMAKFMIAHLQKGELNGIRILKKSSAEFMHQRQFSNHPGFPGMALGFIEDYINGYRLLRHSGAVAGFKTSSVLIPELQMGLFISCNIEYRKPMGRKTSLGPQVMKFILDRYYPPSERLLKDEWRAGGFPKSVEGSYRKNRLARKQLTKSGSFGNDLDVRVLDDQTILVGNDKFKLIGPLLFEKDGGNERLGFRTDENAVITHLFKGSAAIAWDRLTFFETSRCYLILLGVSGGIFLLSVLLTPYMIYRYRIKKEGHRLVLSAYWLSGAVSFINIASMALLVWTLFRAIYISFFWTLPTGFELVLVLPIISGIVALILAGLTLQLWIKKYGRIFERIFLSTVIIGCLFYAYFLNYWNLLGFHT